MNYKTFNLNLFKKMIETKKQLLIDANIIESEIIRMHPLDFLYLKSKSTLCTESEGLFTVYEMTISVDNSAPFINDLTTVTL